MAPPQGRDGATEKVSRSIGDPGDERATSQSSTMRLAERRHEHDHVASSGSDQVPAAERAGGHAAISMVDQAFLIGQAPAAELACGHADDISVDQVCGFLTKEAPTMEGAPQNGPTSAFDHALALESPDAAKVPAHGNSAPAPSIDHQVPAGEEDFGHRPLVAIEQVPSAGQSAIPRIQQVPGRVCLQGPRDRPPGRRRNRWDQAPSRCLNCTGQARRIMTCCRVLLCTDCAFVNPCGCREWAAGYGCPVPILPRYEIPEECIVDDPVLLSGYPRWQLFYTSRVGDQVWYWFYCAEDAYNNPNVVRYQFHRYETNGRSWSQFQCLIIDYPERRVQAYFVAPPMSELDIQVMQYLVSEAHRRRSEFFCC